MKKGSDKNMEGQGTSWTRRSFAASVLSGIGLAMARAVKGDKGESPVSLKEASHYVCLETNEESN